MNIEAAKKKLEPLLFCDTRPKAESLESPYTRLGEIVCGCLDIADGIQIIFGKMDARLGLDYAFWCSHYQLRSFKK